MGLDGPFVLELNFKMALYIVRDEFGLMHIGPDRPGKLGLVGGFI
jgi:hypothetical protein